MTEDERELLRKLQRLNSDRLPALVGAMLQHPAGATFPAASWRVIGEALAELGAACHAQADAIEGIVPAEIVEEPALTRRSPGQPHGH